jgi:hypothetical protein
VHRLVFDQRLEAMIKTISFSAVPDAFRKFLVRLEGELRRQIGELEEHATPQTPAKSDAGSALQYRRQVRTEHRARKLGQIP